MKFLRGIGFLFLGASLAYASEWTDDASKKSQAPAANQTVASTPAQAAPAAAAEEAPADQSATEAPASNDSKEQPAETTESAPAAEPAQAAESTQADQSGPHVVVKGDTLWDLADSFYSNPWEWKKIWDANKSQIDNPDLIFPDQKFVIPGKSVTASVDGSARKKKKTEETSADADEKSAAAPAEEKPADETAAAPDASEQASAPTEDQAEPAKEEEVAPPQVKKTTKRGALKTGSFLTDKDWEGSGKIIGDKEHKILLGQGDIVYLNVGASNGVKAKLRGTIYRRGRLVRDPDTGDKVGYAINRLGVLEVTQEVTDNSATAVIVKSEDPVRVGDFVSLDE